MFFLKLFLLLVYFTLLLLVFHVIDQFAWNGQGNCSTVIDPFSLSLKQLRWLLNLRGINYNQAVEKSDLNELISETGSVTNDEIKLAEFADKGQPKTTTFSSVHQFDDHLQQSGEVWLIRIVAEGENGNISPSEWNNLVKRTNMIGVQCGQILCETAPQLCDEKAFLASQLLLSYHHGGNHRQNLHFIHRSITSGGAFNWMASIFNQKIVQVSEKENLQDILVKERKGTTQILYISPAKQTPAVFGSLQLKFNKVEVSRINTMTMVDDVRSLLSNHIMLSNTVVYFKTPKADFVYGCKSYKGEQLNFSHLSLYLMLLNPDINQFFTLSVYICNFLGALSVFTCQGYIMSRGISVAKSIFAYNFVLLGAWLVFSSTNVEIFNELLHKVTENLQLVNSTEIMGLVRAGVVRTMQMPITFLAGFVVFFNVMLFLLQKLGLITYDLEYELTELLLDDDTQATNDISHRWIQRLATPELWLQPLIPNDYIDELPVWEFLSRNNCGSDNSENDRSVSSHRTSSTSPPRLSREHSRGRPCFPTLPRQSPTLTQGLLRSIRSYVRGRSPRMKKTKNAPANMRKDTSCAICLDNFQHRVLVCGLPCSHVFHHTCVSEWLYNDKHCCPVCRWPAFKPK